MKKSILTLSLLLITLGFTLTSCDKNDDPKPEPDPEVVTATVQYAIPHRYELLKLVDMTVYYTNNEGKEVSEVVSTTTWEKSLTKAPVPGTYELKVVYTRNQMPLEQDSYKFGHGLSLSFTTSSGNAESKGSGGSATISKNKVEEYLKKFTEEKGSANIIK